MFQPARMLLSPTGNRYCLCSLLLILLSCFPSTSGYSQGGRETTGNGGPNKVQGRIYFPSGRRTDNSTVKVNLESTSSERLSVVADLNGSFTFNGLAPGNYHLTVDAGIEYEPSSELIIIEQLSIRSRSISGGDLGRINAPRTFNVMVSLRLKRGYSRKAVLNAPRNRAGSCKLGLSAAMEAARSRTEKSSSFTRASPTPTFIRPQ